MALTGEAFNLFALLVRLVYLAAAAVLLAFAIYAFVAFIAIPLASGSTGRAPYAHAASLIRRAAGPGTTVSHCREHGAAITCRYRTPGAATIEYENGEQAPAEWESYATVEHGHVRFA